MLLARFSTGRKWVVAAFILAVIALPAAAQAANISFSADTTLSGDWDSYTTIVAVSGSEADSITVEPTTITVSVTSGSTLTLRASSNINFSNTAGLRTVCGATPTLSIGRPVTSLVITPSGSGCPTGSSAPAPSPSPSAPPAETAPTPEPTPTTTTQAVPSLSLTKAVAITSQTSTAGVASSAASTGFLAVAFGVLLSSAFILHRHNNPKNHALNFFAIFPLLLTSSARAFERLALRQNNTYQSAYTRHKKLFSITRFSAMATALAGAAKLLLLVALITFQVPASTRLFAQSFADDGKSVLSGSTLTYRLTLSNAGSGGATNLTFTDSIPTGTSFVSGSTKINSVASGNEPSGGVLTIPFASLAASETKTIEFAATITASSGVVSNQASVSYAESATAVSSNAVSNSVTAPAATPEPTCSCTEWTSGSCGVDTCSTTQRQQTRTCTPSGCGATAQCVADSTCAPSPAEEEVQPQPQPQPKPQPQPAPEPTAEPTPTPTTTTEVTPAPTAAAPAEAAPAPTTKAPTPKARAPVVLPRVAPPPQIIPVKIVVTGVATDLSRIDYFELVIESDPIYQRFKPTSPDLRYETTIELPPGRHKVYIVAVETSGAVPRASEVKEFSVSHPICYDGLDNDGDGLFDYPQDPGCAGLVDADEFNSVVQEVVESAINTALTKIEQVAPAVAKPLKAVNRVILENPKVESVASQIIVPTTLATAAVASSATATIPSFLPFLQYLFTQPLLLAKMAGTKEL